MVCYDWTVFDHGQAFHINKHLKNWTHLGHLRHLEFDMVKFWNIEFWNIEFWNIEFWNIQFYNSTFKISNFEISSWICSVWNKKGFYGGFLKSLTVFFVPLRESFGATNSQITMAVTLMPCMFLSGGVLSSKLYHLCGTRVVGLIGGLLTTIGFIMAAFSTGPRRDNDPLIMILTRRNWQFDSILTQFLLNFIYSRTLYWTL